MEKTKRILIFIMLAALLFSFSGCSQAESVYDDEEKIAEIFDTCVATRYIQNYQKTNDVITVNSHADYFSGADKICEIVFTQDAVFDVKLAVTEGRFKIVLISEDKTVYTLYENGSDLLIDLSQIADGTYVMKFVGQQATFDLDMTVNLSK